MVDMIYGNGISSELYETLAFHLNPASEEAWRNGPKVLIEALRSISEVKQEADKAILKHYNISRN